jgi:hypothetical protein
MDIPKKYQRFKGVDPRELGFSSANNRKYICRQSGKGMPIEFFTGSMEPVNAQKLLDDYKHWWKKNH